MPGHTVPEINTPRQRGSDSIGAIGKPGKEAADAPDSCAEGEGDHKRIPRALAKAQTTLHNLNARPRAKDAPDNRLPAQPSIRFVPQRPIKRRRFRPSEQFRPKPRAKNTPNQQPQIRLKRSRRAARNSAAPSPLRLGLQRAAFAKPRINPCRKEIADPLQNRVRMELITKKVNVNGEIHEFGRMASNAN